MVNTMEIGKIIKNLRRESGYTQEELAEIIGVTSQAVSKWESGAGLPDISQVVPLSRALNVNTDVLFGNNEEEEQKRLAEFYEQLTAVYSRLANEPDKRDEIQADAIALYREIVRELPHHYDLQLDLAANLTGEGKSGKIEAIEILKRILERSTDINLRTKATALIASTLTVLGSYEGVSGALDEAQEWANTLPDLNYSRESTLATIAFSRALSVLGAKALNGGEVEEVPPQISKSDAEELIKPVRDALFAAAQKTSTLLFQLAEFGRRLGVYDKDEHIALMKLDIPLTELTILDYEDSFPISMSSAYLCVARSYAIYGDYENALEYLKIFAEYGVQISADITQPDTPLDADGNPIGEETEMPMRQMLANLMVKTAHFKPLRGNPRFVAAVAQLRGE